MEPFKLGPYEIREQLGQGGMGAVYRAWDTANNTMRAVKVLPLSMASKTGFQARFGIEIETLRKLDHPNIIRFFGWGQEQDGTLFYGMELVEGVTLEDEIDRGRRFTWRQVIDTTQQLAKALKHAHDRGVIHRDIKPANVMLTEDGTVKLADFGIARLYGITGLTQEGGPIGTASYMSPEQTEGGKITERSDLYSLGCLIFAQLTGRPPFVADSLSQLMKLHRTQEAIPIRQLNPTIPPAVEAIVSGLLAKDPADRIPTTSALLRSLQMAAQVEDVPDKSDDDRIILAPPAKPGKKPGTVVRSLSDMTTPGAPPRPIAKPEVKKGEDTAVGIGPDTDIIPTDNVAADDTGAPGTLTPTGDTIDPSDETQVTNSPAKTTPLQSADQTLATSLLRDGGGAATQASNVAARSTSAGANPTVSDPLISHFTTAEEAARYDKENREAERTEEAQQARRSAIKGYIILVSLLATVAVLGYWFTRPPTLSQRIAQLNTLAESDNPDSLLDAETSLRDFVRLYPTHSRSEEVNQYLEEIELMRLERRLDVRARHGRGLKSQGPLERSYLEAIKYSQIEPELGQRKLQAILALYDTPGALHNDDAQQLLSLTRRRLEQVTASINEQTAMEKGFIRTRIEWAEQNIATSRDESLAACQGIVDLYSEKTWAGEYVRRARLLLTTAEVISLDSPSDSDDAADAGKDTQ